MVKARRSVAAAVSLLVVGLALISAPAAVAGATSKGDGSGGRAVAHAAGGRGSPGRRWPAGLPKRTSTTSDTTPWSPPWASTSKATSSTPRPELENEVVRSSDGGKELGGRVPQLAGRNRHAISLDPYLWVDEDTGRAFTIDLTVACSLMSFSDDRGKTWTTNPLACGRPINDHQTLFGGPPVTRRAPSGYENVLYYCWNDLATSSCGKSTDGGISFRPTGSPAFSPVTARKAKARTRPCGGGCTATASSVATARSSCPRSTADVLTFAISKDEGVTWNCVRVSSKVAIFGPIPASRSTTGETSTTSSSPTTGFLTCPPRATGASPGRSRPWSATPDSPRPRWRPWTWAQEASPSRTTGPTTWTASRPSASTTRRSSGTVS